MSPTVKEEHKLNLDWEIAEYDHSRTRVKKPTNLGHGWISPDYYLVLGEPMSTNKFINILRPCQIAHLPHKTKIRFMSTLTLKYVWPLKNYSIPQITNIPSMF